MAKYLSLFAMLVCIFCMCGCQQKNSTTSDDKTQSEDFNQQLSDTKISLLTLAEMQKMYNKYRNVSQDALLKKASRDDVDAIFELAQRADNPMNRAESFRLYHQAAVKGHIIAQCETAIRLLDGDGVERNVEDGIHWLEKSAKNGNPRAVERIATCYVDGTYKHDGRKAIRLAENAVKADWFSAYYILGMIYYKGIDVKQDYQKAFSYFMKGTDVEPPVAGCEAMVGACYCDGTGTVKDFDKGISYIKLAVRHGCYEAVQILDKLGINPY